MHAAPAPDAQESHANAAFSALLWALSRPGLAQVLPEPGEQPIIAALLDRECAVFTSDAALAPAIVRTGAEKADLPDADYAFLGDLADAQTLHALRAGSDLYPDDAATAVLRVRIGTGTLLRLAGPGVNGSIELAVDGLPDGFWQTREQLIRYPMGFDLFLLDGARVVGIPRSTKVEVP